MRDIDSAEEWLETWAADTQTGRAVVHSYAQRFPQPPDEHGDDPRDRRAR